MNEFSGTFQTSSYHYWRPRLCRVFLHSAKSPLHSARQSPLGKIFLGKGSLPSVFNRGTRQNKKQFCRVLGAALGKIFSAVAAPAVNGYFAESPAQHSANFFLFFLKITLSSAPAQALGKVFFIFFKKVLCRVPLPRHSAKFFYFF